MLVLGRLLADISRNLPNKPIEVSASGSKVEVSCGSSRFSLLQMPVGDYPSLPVAPESSGSIDGHAFTQAVSQVSIAADRGDTPDPHRRARRDRGRHDDPPATDRYRPRCVS